MKTSDFYYDLPQELIAQDPLEDRSGSRLLVLDRETGKREHRIFRDRPWNDLETFHRRRGRNLRDPGQKRQKRFPVQRQSRHI